MKLGATIQQPSERLDYDFSYTEWFGSEEDAVIEVTATASPAGLTLYPLIRNPQEVKLWVEGGLDNTTYYVEITVTTEAGRIKQDELEIIFQEIV